MIFKENISTSTSNILPAIINNQNENREAIQENEEIRSRNRFENNLTIDINHTDNNRYNLQDNFEKENFNEIKKDKESQSQVQTITSSRNITSDIILYKAKNPFLARVELENIRSKKDCIYLLEEYLKNNNINPHYEINNNQDKIIFSFYDEQTAFEFTKIIYNEKNKNVLYKNVLVHLRLLPNKSYLKRQKLEKKRGLSFEGIIKLYKGSSYVKKPKELPKIKGNINFGLKSPFYNVHKSHNKISSYKIIKQQNCFSRNSNKGDLFGYLGYDGNPLKSYEKSKISVLDTHYNPFSNMKYREEDKKKWVSPSNFKYY